MIFGSTGYAESLSPTKTSSLDSARTPESESRSAGIGVEKLLSTGATVTVDSGIRRRWSNNNADLSLVADLTYLGRDREGEASYRGAYRRDGQDWNVGLQFRVLWGTRAAEARLRQTERNLEREKLLLYDLKQQKALAVRRLWRAVQAGLRRIEVTRKALELNREAFKQQRARYSSGVLAYRTVLEAQRDFDAARRNQLAAMIETLQAQVELSRVDSTILPRNGFRWETVDQLSIPPDPEAHPLQDAIKTDS